MVDVYKDSNRFHVKKPNCSVTDINYFQIGKEALAVVFRVTNVRYFNPDIDHKSSEIKSLL